MASIATRAFSACEKRFPNEPKAPVLKTAFPGPKNIAYAKQFTAVGDTLQMDVLGFPIDTENSLGNYISDIDGN